MFKYVSLIVLCLVVACATAPKTASGRQDLINNAQATLQEMINTDPSLRDVLGRAAGYAVFPSVGKGGFVVGGAYGRGVLFQNGQVAGFVDLNQGSLGAQLGAQTFSQLVVFQSQRAIDRLKGGTFQFGGEMSAVALTAGAGAATQFRNDVAVFIRPRGGVMAGISLTGQQLNFTRG